MHYFTFEWKNWKLGKENEEVGKEVICGVIQNVKGHSLAFAGKDSLGTTSYSSSMLPDLASRDTSEVNTVSFGGGRRREKLFNLPHLCCGF